MGFELINNWDLGLGTPHQHPRIAMDQVDVVCLME